MKNLKRFTLDDIRKLGPCYDPIKYGKDSQSYTILDVINSTELPFDDKLWLIFRTEFVSERTMRLFAVWSYRQTLNFITNPDPRSIEAANVAEKYANGLATNKELESAASAAYAAYVAASAASAAYAAYAAYAAAESAYAASAAYAAYVASESAYAASAAYAAYVAASAAYAAAESAVYVARSAQQEKLKQMILDGIETGDTVTE